MEEREPMINKKAILEEILRKLTFVSIDNSISGRIISIKNWNKEIARTKQAIIDMLPSEEEIIKILWTYWGGKDNEKLAKFKNLLKRQAVRNLAKSIRTLLEERFK